jgi:hypothetical protein
MLGGALSVALWFASAGAMAQEDAATRAAARKLAEDGVAALQNGDATTATQKLEKAHQMLKAPSVALWSARALMKSGQLVEAAERLREVGRLQVTGDAAVQEQAKRDAEKELGELGPRIPSLVVSVVGGDASTSVTLDGNVLPTALLGEDRPVNPGPHRLVARRGAQEASREITLAEGEHQAVELVLAAETNAAPPSVPQPPSEAPVAERGSAHRTLAYVALGAGAAGLVLGGVTGGLAMSKRGQLDDNPACRDGTCDYSVEDEVKSLRTFRTVSTVGFVAGGVLGAAGVVLLVTGGDSRGQGSRSQPRLALRVGPTQLQLAGRF